SPFACGGSEVRPLLASQIDNWEIDTNPKEEAPNVQSTTTQLRKFQGYAAIATPVNAEQQRASEIAAQEADKILAILGIYSGAVLIPMGKCPFSLRAKESFPMATFIFERVGKVVGVRTQPRSHPTSASWIQWSDSDIAAFRQYGFDAAC